MWDWLVVGGGIAAFVGSIVHVFPEYTGFVKTRIFGWLTVQKLVGILGVLATFGGVWALFG